jgi:hypothetical protein
MPLALFGITNSGLNLFVNLVILFLVVVWIALIAWTYLDARRRIEDPVLVTCAAGASLFPYVGTIVYTILRPPEFLEDMRERELEIRASQLRVRQLEEQSCPNCEYPIERNYLRCPNCRVRVKDPCESCGKPVDPRWTLCPYCETPLRRTAPSDAQAARRAQAERAPKAAPRATRRPVRKTPSGGATERKAASSGAESERPASPARGGSRSSGQRTSASKGRTSSSSRSSSSRSSGARSGSRREPPAAPAS